MNAPRKFLFETTFESDVPTGAPRPAEKVKIKTFTEEEMAKAREEGFAAGKEVGQKAAEDLLERDIARTLENVTQQLAELGKAQAEAIERRDHETIEAALTIIRKLFPSLAEAHGMVEIETIIGDCLARLRDEARVVIRVANPVLDTVNERVAGLAAKAGFEGKLVLIAQEDLQAGDVRVEWADGGAERDSKALWAEIDSVLARAIGLIPSETASTPTIEPTPDAPTPEADRPIAVSQ
jgi:flagellar assembly protein FliH